MNLNLAERFLNRFPSLERAYGQTTLEGTPEPGQKQKSKSWTEKGSGPTTELWSAHLSGGKQLGCFPLRDDGTCQWGAIDIDDYTLDPLEAEAKVRTMGLPLMVCRSKSNGVHYYLFLSEAMAAVTLRATLLSWVQALGHPKYEIFPKHDRLYKPTSLGNWINMPYAGGEESPRHGLYMGARLGAAAFLDLLDAPDGLTIHPDRLAEVVAKPPGERWFPDGPPCLQTLVNAGPVPKGSGDHFLMAVGRYLRLRHGDDTATDYLEDYNELLDEPATEAKIGEKKTSIMRQEYRYNCKNPPLSEVCDSKVCVRRLWGVARDLGQVEDGIGLSVSKNGNGAVPATISFGELEKYDMDRPQYMLNVNGQRVQLTTAQLMSAKQLRTRVLEVTNLLMPDYMVDAWETTLRSKLQHLVIHEMSPEASDPGQVRAWLEQYFAEKTISNDREDLKEERPYLNDKNGLVYFSGDLFHKYIQRNHHALQSKQNLYVTLREIGAKENQLWIAAMKRPVVFFTVPPFASLSADESGPPVFEEM